MGQLAADSRLSIHSMLMSWRSPAQQSPERCLSIHRHQGQSTRTMATAANFARVSSASTRSALPLVCMKRQTPVSTMHPTPAACTSVSDGVAVVYSHVHPSSGRSGRHMTCSLLGRASGQCFHKCLRHRAGRCRRQGARSSLGQGAGCGTGSRCQRQPPDRGAD